MKAKYKDKKKIVDHGPGLGSVEPLEPAVYSQTRNWLLVGKCTAYIAVTLYFHTKRLKED
jgi:hypothetical protein